VKAIVSVLSFLFAVFVVLFAVSNRAAVTIEFWPLPFEWTAGLYVPVLIALVLGFAAGTVAAWLMGAPKRRQARQNKDRIRSLERLVNEGKTAS